MCYRTNYKIYDKKKLLNEAINRREEDRGSIITLFFELNHLSFALHYKPNYFGSDRGLAHFDFHALSKGFEEFTSTGYHSIFVNSSERLSSYADIKSFIFKKLNEKIDLEKLSATPMQLNLFEV